MAAYAGFMAMVTCGLTAEDLVRNPMLVSSMELPLPLPLLLH